MALYFASGRWGNGTGIYNYHAEADRLITDMLHHEVAKGQLRGRPYACGNMFDPEHKMVRFVPDIGRENMTDPSYHLPGFYELWARWAPEADRAFWADAAKASRDFFPKEANPKTGLGPDMANWDGTPYSWNKTDPAKYASNFRFDSWRTASNWSFDWNWWAKDPRERELADRIQAFFESQGMDKYGCLYTLDGQLQTNPKAQRHAWGLIATNAVASLAATDQTRARKFVKAFWDCPIPNGIERYYDGMLYLLSFLHVSGNYRVWAPK
jgi:oligosaccharide reducing-end xylanase